MNGVFAGLFKVALASYPIAAGGMVAFGVWVVTQIHQQELFRVETSATRFRLADWMAAKQTIDSENILQNQRISKVEDHLEGISRDINKGLDKLDFLTQQLDRPNSKPTIP